jgi:hypothetical protein
MPFCMRVKCRLSPSGNTMKKNADFTLIVSVWKLDAIDCVCLCENWALYTDIVRVCVCVCVCVSQRGQGAVY